MASLSKRASEPQPASATPAPRRGRPPKVDRATALEVGLRLVRERGVEALTIRSIAEELGVAPATLYGHFPDKDALLTAIAERAWDSLYVEIPTRGRWRARVAGWMIEVRKRLLEAPELPALLQSVPPQPVALLRTTRALAEVLEDAGFDRAAAVERAQGLVWVAVGYYVIEASRSALGVAGQHRQMLASLPEGERAATEAILPVLGAGGGDDAYEALVEALVRGLR